MELIWLLKECVQWTIPYSFVQVNCSHFLYWWLETIPCCPQKSLEFNCLDSVLLSLLVTYVLKLHVLLFLVETNESKRKLHIKTSNYEFLFLLPASVNILFFMQIHWFSVFNSFMMVIFLTGLVSMILMRTLRNDYAKYAREDDDLESLVIFFFLNESCIRQLHIFYGL